LALLGLCVAQIVASASNLYLLSDALPKRTYACILGGIMSLLSFVPTFRHYRFLAFLAIVGTAYTALYLTIDAATIGPQEDVTYGAPTSFTGFFTGFVNLVFMFGAHTAAIEKAVVMDDPYHYDKAYGHATIYVYLITLPTGITGYHSFGLEAQHKSNAFYLFPASPARSIALVVMIIHQFVAFGLFGKTAFDFYYTLMLFG
jgi:auxin influx carrier (AUX1 LAX family)